MKGLATEPLPKPGRREGPGNEFDISLVLKIFSQEATSPSGGFQAGPEYKLLKNNS